MGCTDIPTRCHKHGMPYTVRDVIYCNITHIFNAVCFVVDEQKTGVSETACISVPDDSLMWNTGGRTENARIE
jgi:hypothetical protein